MATFSELEAGKYSSPALLYRFQRGSDFFNYTNIEGTLTFQTINYEGIAIKSDPPKVNPRERRGTRIKIKVPLGTAPFDDYVAVLPTEKVTCTIYRVQREERLASPEPSPLPTPSITNVGIIFDGFITSVSYKDQEAIAELSPNIEQFAREIPRFKYHSICNHVLYDSRCKVNKNSFKSTVTVNSVTGNVINVSGLGTPANFIGGYLYDVGNDDYRMIIDADVSGNLTLLLPFLSVNPADTLDAFQGCNHTVNTCRDKFSNVINFGGFPFVPSKNPFNQSRF